MKQTKDVMISANLCNELLAHLSSLSTYLRGEHNHETDDIQRSEDLNLYKETDRLYVSIKRCQNPLNIEVVQRNGKFGVLDNDEEAVPFYYDDMWGAIQEWEHFETLNLNEQPHRRFLPHVRTAEEIESIVAKYRPTDLTDIANSTTPTDEYIRSMSIIDRSTLQEKFNI